MAKTLETVVELSGAISPSLQKTLKDAHSLLGNIGSKSLVTKAAIAGMVTGTAVAVVKSVKYLNNLGAEFDAAADKIRIGTGATGEALESLNKDFDAVYSGVPTSMEAASQAIADYNTRLGLTGPELQNISKQAIQVADALDEDLTGVIKHSSEAIQIWDIDAADMGGAMDYVFKAAQSTGMGFSDLMAKTQEYAPQLKELGYGFKDSVALIGQLEKAGLNTTEVLAGMKRGMSNLAKEGIPLNKGFEQYTEKIKGAADMTEAISIASEVFGTRSASTMAAAIREGKIDVAALTAELEANGETISQCAEDTYDYAERLQLFKQQAEVALKPLASTVFDSVNDLMPIMGELMQGITPLIADMAAKLQPIFAKIVPMITPILQKLLPPLMELGSILMLDLIPIFGELTSLLLPVLIELIGMLTPIFTTICSQILPIIVSLIRQLLPPAMQIIETLLPVLSELLIALLPLISTILSILQPILDLAIGLIQPCLDLIIMCIEPILPLIQMLIEILNSLSPVITLISSLVSDYLGTALQNIQPIIQGVQTILSGLIQFVTGVFTGNWSSAWSGVVQTFSGIWQTLTGFVKAPINGVIGLVNSAIRRLNGISCTIPDWVPVVGGQTFGVNLPTIPMLAKGGFTEGLSIAGEEAMEAVISFDPVYRAENLKYWAKAGSMLGAFDDNEPTLSSTASKLMMIDDFSLGSLAAGQTIIIYDFSGFTWSPTIETHGGDASDFMDELRAHEYEFADWFEEWVKVRMEGVY